MKLFATARNKVEAIRHELQIRLRLLAAAFARRLPDSHVRDLPAEQLGKQLGKDYPQPQSDLLTGLNSAGLAAGLQVWDWDLVANTLKFDRNVMDHYGGDAREAEANPGDFVAQAVHPDDLAHYRREFIRALKGEAPLCIDYRVLHKDGSTHPVQLRGQVFRAPTVDGVLGRAIRMVGFTIDMRSQLGSARPIEAQAEIERQSAAQRALLDRLNLATHTAGISIWDKDLVNGTFVCDEQFWKIFGLTPDSRFKVHDGIHADERANALAPLNVAFADASRDEILSVRHRTSNPRPEPQFVQTHMRVFRDDSGKPVRLLGVTWDVTSEKLHANELQRQADKERALIERLNVSTQAAGISPWEIDIKTNCFSWHGPRPVCFGMDHVPLADYLNELTTIVLPEDVHLVLESGKDAIGSHLDNYEYRFRVHGIDGKIHHMHNYVRVLRSERGNIRYLVGVTSDVTKEVEVAEQLRQQAESERALVERLNVVTKAARISPWEFDLKTNHFSWQGLRQEFYGLDDVPLAEYHIALTKLVLEEDRHILTTASRDAVLSNTDHYTYQFRVRGTDGKIHTMRNICELQRNARGNYRYIMGVTMEVTQEVEANLLLEQRAEENRKLVERLSIATESAHIGSWEMDLVAQRFLWVDNPVKTLGIADQDFGSLDEFATHIVPEDRTLLPENIRRAVKDNTNRIGFRYRAIGQDGAVIHIQTFGRIMTDERRRPVRALGVSWDITHEVQAAERLRNQAENERALVQRLNVATQAAGISPWEFDLKTNNYLWFGARLAVLGLDDEPIETYYEALKNVLLPEDRNVLHDAAVKAITNGIDMYSALYRANGIDGQVHHLKNFVRVLRSPRGTPYRLVGVTWDISDEVAAKAQLQQQAEHERALVDRLNLTTRAAGISPWEFDLKTSKLSWLGIQLNALGLQAVPVDRYMESLRKAILPEDLAAMDDAASQALKSGVEVYSYRYRALGTDGHVHHMKNFVRILRSARGTPYRLVGVTWDISEEVAASERLEAQVQHAHALKERLSIAAMAAGISPFEIDLTTGKFLWVENPIKALTGIRGDDNALTTFSQRIHPEDVNHFRDEIVRAAKGGYDVITYRYRAIANDDSIVHVQTYAKLYFNEKRRATRALGVSWDATKDIQAAERLQLQAEHERKLLERLNIATDSAGITSWEIDLVAAKFLWIENPLKPLLHAGDMSDDVSSSVANFAQRILPEDRGLLGEAIHTARKNNTDRIAYRYRAVGIDGSLVHVQTFARLIFAEGNQPIRVLGVSWDVTREMLATEQLRQQTDRLRDVERRLERASLSSSEGHWEAELASGHLWCSSSFHTLLGYTEGELEPRVSAFDQLVHLDDRPAYHTALRNHLTHNDPYDVETRMHMGNGDYRWFRMRGMAERDAQGQPTVMAGSIHDVHQQKLVEDALNLAQRRFERAINGTQDGLWELDAETDAAWCSPRLALLLGYPVAELENNNFLRLLIHPDDADTVTKVTASHYRHNTPFDIEVRLKIRTGEHRWYRARATAERDTNGRATRLSGSLQDVTEARSAREELVRATEAAETANRAKSAFLANVSHEIRTPMNGIIGMTGLLIDTQLDRTQRDYATTIRSSADSLLAVINDILDFSKIEAGKLDVEKIEMDLRANVEDVGTMLAFQAANKGLELIINIHPEVPEQVLGDPQRIRQCLINLIGNAIKFTKQGEIVVDVCVVGRHEGRVLTHFEVRDTGMGIPTATLSTLFQPFVQADSSTTRHFGGTGLGLSIVRRLVEMMGGKVGVVSHVGAGSAFFFTLSLEPKDSSVVPIARSVAGSRILIVDDNATNRRVLEGLLVHQGYCVTLADSGAAALAHLRAVQAEAIDMVITDFQMPDMDGLMLGEQIASDPALARLRLIMLTSLDRQGDSKQLAALGFAAYLTKPVRTRELLDCVAHVFSGEARQWQMEMRPMITRHSLAESQAQQRFVGHVLLVEDNIVNQKVAARFLERMGCTVHIAAHGADGVAAFMSGTFALVLMDLQMPILDGLAATRRIRELESADSTRSRTPIVALTANAMRGDQERCEAAGMNGFLTKPIEIERLRDTLTKFGLSADRSAMIKGDAVQAILEETAVPPPVELARLNEITGGDAGFAKELIDTFVASGEAQLIEIRAALDTNDRNALARAAHKLKGACANIHAEEARALVARLETEAATASDTELHACNALLQRAFARAKDFLNDPSVTPAQVRAAS